ncbi:MAG: putative metalloprotease CJM1_0395 family protein [Fibrobacterota bacterium]
MISGIPNITNNYAEYGITAEARGCPGGNCPDRKRNLSADTYEPGVGAEFSQSNKLSDEEKKEVEELKKRDREVRNHEQAHVAAGGQYVKGGPTYEFQTGPDNKRYAVGGHVDIDTSPESDPEKTIAKMQQVKRAALAPAEPSGADRAVAGKASSREAEARAELREEKQEEVKSEKKDGKSSGYNSNASKKISRAASGSLVALTA